MLGRLRMTVSQAIDAMSSIISVLSLRAPVDESTREANTIGLRSAIEQLFITRDMSPDGKMLDKPRPPTKCKV